MTDEEKTTEAVSEDAWPEGYPVRLVDRAAIANRPVPEKTKRQNPIRYEYDVIDWWWRMGFGVLGFAIGLLVMWLIKQGI